MKRIVLVAIVTLALAGFASAQVTSPSADVLGAHNVYGRGCIACHAPHSGAAANGAPTSPNSGNLALWGENLVPLYGVTFTFAGGDAVTIPNYNPVGGASVTVGTTTYAAQGLPSTADDGTFIIAACLSCHDGNVATSGMMRGSTVETVNISGLVFNPPTLLGNDGTTPGNYLNDHPVGPKANPACGGQYFWDCTVNATGTISYTGTSVGGVGSATFLTDYFDVTTYGPIANLITVAGTYTNPYLPGTTFSNSWVTCTTCHDQHDMLYFNAGPTIGVKPTHFFVRGWYNPGNNTTSNSAAQFCRTRHGGESNEMSGQTVGTS